MKNIRKRTVLALLLTVFLVESATVAAQNLYQNEIGEWQKQTEENLKSENGWLSLTNLVWLKEGKNTLGSAAGSDIKLPAKTAHNLGVLEFRDGKFFLTVNQNVRVLANGNIFEAGEIKSDADAIPTVLKSGDVSFSVIKRENRYGVRVRDKNSPNLTEFTGLNWFPINEKYRITADFKPYDVPKEVEIPNILGGVYKMKSPGLLVFKIDGKELMLEPVEEGDKLFIIFADATNRRHTYQSGRFLYAEKADKGKVVLDFNKAHNPPCAYTEFATCPLPPAQNRLKWEIPAGELRYTP